MKKLITLLLIVTVWSFWNIPPVYGAAPTDFVSCWELDETSGTRADSNTTNANDLSDNATVLSEAGVQGNAASTTAANSEYLSITDANQTGLDFSGDHAWSFWVKFQSLDRIHMFFSKFPSAADNRSYRAYYHATAPRIQFEVRDSSSNNTYGYFTWSASVDTWYHIVGSWDWDTETVSIYIDADKKTLTSSATDATGINNSTADFQMGAETFESLYLNGQLDIFEVYDRELTQAEVTTLYASGSGVACGDRAGTVVPIPFNQRIFGDLKITQ
jgi:hypothetical protein